MTGENDLFSHHYHINFLGILRMFLVFIVVAFVTRWTWKWRTFVSRVSKLPMSKLRFYHILGHAHIALQLRRMKTNLPLHVYDFQFMSGYHTAAAKEGFVIVWAIFWPMVHVFRADTVEAILNNTTELEKSSFYNFLQPWLGNGLLTSHGAKWRNRRKLITQAFHFNILNDFLPVINKQAKIFVDILGQRSSDAFIDIVPYAKRCSLDIICESVLGAEIRTQTDPSNPYARSVSSLTETFSERTFNPLIWPDFIFKMSPLGKTFYSHLKIVHNFTHKLIQQKKEKLLSDLSFGKTESDTTSRKRKAFLDLLLDEHVNNNSITEREIREEVDTFTFAGHDTTAMAMSWTLYLIGLHPLIQEKLQQELDSIFGDDDREASMDDLKEMKFLECVLKESLRLYPPAAVYGRQINEDIEIKGHVVPKGCHVIIWTHSLHRDPEVFPNPEKFDPERFFPENSVGRNSFAYIPFSGGPRNCIGQRFALMEEKGVISSILRKFKIRSLDPRDRIHVVNEVVLKPAESLRLEIRPRNHKPEKPHSYFYCP